MSIECYFGIYEMIKLILCVFLLGVASASFERIKDYNIYL